MTEVKTKLVNEDKADNMVNHIEAGQRGMASGSAKFEHINKGMGLSYLRNQRELPPTSSVPVVPRLRVH